ncbi:AIPR family protein [Dyadobacter sp. Leaf189]|uniref:AIPR family protein n=1 Tax=Dyadobacter sp. Leaf189 TaxID=1736295 RepID=UPI0006FA89AE|nr:AIPR family protein [Dyadobacter sp. Leaf189]KQS32742.1 abortive phage infection protein [Dyadobacter sp. Leaf189]
MSDQDQLNNFSDQLLQEVIASSDSEEHGEFRVNEFTRLVSESLIEAGEIDDINVCYYKSRGMHVNGYNVSQDDTCLDIFISVFNQQCPPVTVTKTQTETAFRQAEGMLKKALGGHYTSLEESSEVYDMFLRIHGLRDELVQIRIYLLTDGIVNAGTYVPESTSGITASFHVWDIERLYRFVSSGRKFETIEINFEDEFGTTIPCLSMVDPHSDYQGYLAVIPGEILAGIYEKYGPRLLERNVRSFLQARGNVNKGIRKTILEEPHRFFAYNNGISGTADEIEFADNSESHAQIRKIRNLQIVNGGQTTASLYHTAKKDKTDLKGIYVQAKLSVIPFEQIDEIVPLISRYANSQNKVNDADFDANDPFHVKVEEFSRIVWAPAIDGTNRQTRWFYERARGQYLDAKNRELTPAKKRQFEATAPNKQKFTKTDLAKYENTWMQLPHIVSLGAQKCFTHFSLHLRERGHVNVDVTYFEHLIAKAILFKKAEKVISDQKFGGYRANIVTYTIAWLSHYTSQLIDFDKIWREQNISIILQEAIKTISIEIHKAIVNPPNARNITEWCKRKECWDLIKQLSVELPVKLDAELINLDLGSNLVQDKGIDAPNKEDQALILHVSGVKSETWFEISKWAKETSNLQAWQRSLSFSIGKILAKSGNLSYKQAKHGIAILEEITKLGFKID